VFQNIDHSIASPKANFPDHIETWLGFGVLGFEIEIALSSAHKHSRPKAILKGWILT
jgi:hypothetical protein